MSIDYDTDNTFIFSFVRMNPPTPGHLLVVESMMRVALNLNVNKIFIILSSTMDDKNPMPCSSVSIPKPKTKKLEAIIKANPIQYAYKSIILSDMIEAYKRKMINLSQDEEEKSKISIMSVEIICSTGNPFGFINSVLQKYFIERGVTNINLFFIVGEDRSDFVDRIVDSYKENNNIKTIDARILPREGMQELISTGPGDIPIQDIPLQQFSASFVRKLVQNNKKMEFDEIYRPYLDQTSIDHLYETIQNGLFIYIKSSSSSSATEEIPESRYIKNNLLPIIKGGKNINKKFKKSKKNKKTQKKSYRKTRRNPKG